MNTGSANGQGWGVIDFPRNQSACWESTVRPEQTRGWEGPKMCWEKKRREQNLFINVIHTREWRVADSTCFAQDLTNRRYIILLCRILFFQIKFKGGGLLKVHLLAFPRFQLHLMVILNTCSLLTCHGDKLSSWHWEFGHELNCGHLWGGGVVTPDSICWGRPRDVAEISVKS